MFNVNILSLGTILLNLKEVDILHILTVVMNTGAAVAFGMLSLRSYKKKYKINGKRESKKMYKITLSTDLNFIYSMYIFVNSFF